MDMAIVQAIIVSTCHPKLNTLPSILENDFHFRNFQTKAYCRLPKKNKQLLGCLKGRNFCEEKFSRKKYLQILDKFVKLNSANFKLNWQFTKLSSAKYLQQAISRK